MYQKLRQELRLTQQLVMTPQLQLAIKMLQLSRLELEDSIKTELEENPVLEVDQDTEEANEAKTESSEEDIDWQAYLDEYSGKTPGTNLVSRDNEDTQKEIITAKDATLQDHLLWQLRMSDFTPYEKKIGIFIIGNIDDDGYLRVVDSIRNETEYLLECLYEISKHTEAHVDVVEGILKRIHLFDPVSVGARNLKECLLIQSRLLAIRDALLESMINKHMGDLEKRRYKVIASALSVPFDAVIDAVKAINQFSPRPAMGYGSGNGQMIVPDVYIYKMDGEYLVNLNEDGLPKLRISPYYRKLIKGNGASVDNAKDFVMEKMRKAAWLIKSIHQRQRTISKVVKSIIKFQKDFLDNGIENLRPMGLKDVADDIGVHESTVSRVTANKYVHTPDGVFELKYFFSTSIRRVDGTDVSADTIKEKVRELIALEDSKRPLSDQRIAEMLNRDGFILARRTVAKYRENMGLLSSSRRKRYF